jgi:hypothetical protein
MSGSDSSPELTWNELLDAAAPSYILAVGSERECDAFAHRGLSVAPSVTVRIVRGRRCATERRLFQEWAAALQFPYYFGENWDALDECLSDLEWLTSQQFVFFITQSDALLPDREMAFKSLIDVLKTAVETWNDQLPDRPAAAMRIVFHSEPAQLAVAQAGLEASGVQVEKRRLRDSIPWMKRERRK